MSTTQSSGARDPGCGVDQDDAKVPEASRELSRGPTLEIDVENHPGVMVHVVSLFARRGCNIEGIVCFPIGDGTTSRLWLLLGQGEKLEQMTRFVANLEDVIAVRCRRAGLDAFRRLPELFSADRYGADDRGAAGR